MNFQKSLHVDPTNDEVSYTECKLTDLEFPGLVIILLLLLFLYSSD